MIDAATTRALQETLLRESRSLLGYVHESFPWTPEETLPALRQVRQFAEEERCALDDLGRFLVRHRVGLPYIGPYPAEFTTVNYVSLEHLLPQLADDERRGIRALESQLTQVHDAQALALLEGMLEIKRRHCQALEQLAMAPLQAAAG